jgi:hypothetical protein
MPTILLSEDRTQTEERIMAALMEEAREALERFLEPLPLADRDVDGVARRRAGRPARLARVRCVRSRRRRRAGGERC